MSFVEDRKKVGKMPVDLESMSDEDIKARYMKGSPAYSSAVFGLFVVYRELDGLSNEEALLKALNHALEIFAEGMSEKGS
jgi:hypothetical protein